MKRATLAIVLVLMAWNHDALAGCRRQCRADEVHDARGCCVPRSHATCPTVTLTTRTLPLRTAVITECLVIPDHTTLTIPDGGQLLVLATRRARIGTDVHIVARGGPGGPGANGRVKDWPAPHAQYWAAKDSGCKAGKTGRNEENYDLVGKKGGTGHPGGDVRFVLRNATGGAGFDIDASGGDGGPPGGSGHLHCYCNEHGNGTGNENGGILDGDSPPNEGKGDSGTPGTLRLAVFGAAISKIKSALVSAVKTKRIASSSELVRYSPVEAGEFERLEAAPLRAAANAPGVEKILP